MRPLLLAVLLAGCAPKIPPGPVPVDEAQKPVDVIELQDSSSPNVYFQALVRAGSAHDPEGGEGLAAWVAQGLVDAGAGGKSSTEVRDALYPTGNQFDLVVDKEWVSLRLRCHTDHTDLCLDLFANALTRPDFDGADMSRLREAAVYAVGDGMLGDEEALGQALLDASVFEAHPYGHPVRGRGGALPTLTTDQARAFHQAHYVREAMVVGVAGNVDDEAVNALKQRLEAVPGTRAPELLLPQPVPVEGRTLAIADVETAVTGIHFGHPIALDRNHADWPALTLAMTATGAHRQSFGRLFKRLRTARGLNYGTYSYVENYVQRGWTSLPENGVLRAQPHFYVWVRPTSLENGPFALRMALAEIELLVEEGLTAEEFTQIRAYLQGWVPLLAQDPGRRLAFALDARATGTPDLLAHLPAALDDLTVEEVNAAIARHIDPANLRIVAVSGEAEALRDRLLADGPTPIVYRDVTPSEEQAARDAELAEWPLELAEDDIWTVDAQGIFR